MIVFRATRWGGILSIVGGFIPIIGGGQGTTFGWSPLRAGLGQVNLTTHAMACFISASHQKQGG
jgi:hypothetical protein